MKRKVIILSIAFLLISLLPHFFGNSIVKQSQAQACAAPTTPAGVTVDYPGCSGGSCDLTQATCSWTLQGDAASYNVTVTEVETGTIIKNNENQAGTVSSVSFPVTQKRTYKCDVLAVAACGTLSAAASDQLLCDADAIIDTPTPTTPPATTAPEIPNKPTIAPPGGILETVGIMGGVALVIIAGIMLLVL